jgi:FAD/FMN-containing dehydrogenase
MLWTIATRPVGAVYERAEEADVHEAWVSAFATDLRQGNAGVHVNFLGDKGEGRIREAYPRSTWDRLAAIKSRYDPTNLFRLNQNIRLAARGTEAVRG